MTTKKRRVSQKAGKKGSKKATKTVSEEVFTAEDLTHSPIVITDGSGSVEFDRREYVHLGSGNHLSLGLRLDKVEVRRIPNGPVIHTCQTFTGTDVHRIVAHCMLGNLPTEITIVGASEASIASVSPTLDFRRGNHFIEDSATFPHKFPFGRRFGNRNIRITRFTITNLNTGQIVHDCPLTAGGGFEYTIIDAHA
jgi:hypothetical protein